MFQQITDWFSSLFGSDDEPEVKPTKTRKKPDNTFINTDQKRFIREAFEAHEAYNASLPRPMRKTQNELRDELNEILGLNKSTSSYRRIWSKEEH